jgi:hypothetical protein
MLVVKLKTGPAGSLFSRPRKAAYTVSEGSRRAQYSVLVWMVLAFSTEVGSHPAVLGIRRSPLAPGMPPEPAAMPAYVKQIRSQRLQGSQASEFI